MQTKSVRDAIVQLIALADEATRSSVTEDVAVRTAFGRAIDEVFALGRTPRHRAGPPPGWVLVERAMVRADEIARGDAGCEPLPGALRGAVADVRAAIAIAALKQPAARALVVLASHASDAAVAKAAIELVGRGVTAATVVAASQPVRDGGHLLDVEVGADHHTDQSWFVSDRRARLTAAVLQAHGIDADFTVVPARLVRGAVDDRLDAGDVSAVVTVGSTSRIPFSRGWRVARHSRRAGVELVAA